MKNAYIYIRLKSLGEFIIIGNKMGFLFDLEALKELEQDFDLPYYWTQALQQPYIQELFI